MFFNQKKILQKNFEKIAVMTSTRGPAPGHGPGRAAGRAGPGRAGKILKSARPVASMDFNAPLFSSITPPFYQILTFTYCTAELIAPLKQLFFKHRCIKRLLKTPLKFQYTAVFLNTAVFFKTPLSP